MIEQLLKDRYFVPGEESWSDVCVRVSNFLFPDDNERADRLRVLMEEKKFLPSSPTLMNAGTATPMLSSCFVLGMNDDLDSIMDVMARAAKVFKMGGGVGIDFSPLRPAGFPIGSTGGTSSGVIDFMKHFNSVVNTIRQGAKRRGAAIATLDISHPDIEEFVECKNVEGDLANMNISVRISDAFMNAVYNNSDWVLEFNGQPVKTVSAVELWDKICDNAHKMAEPGIIFIDTIYKFERNGVDKNTVRLCSNPCGEAVLGVVSGGGESCNLGSIDVSKYKYSDIRDMCGDFYNDVKLIIDALNAVVDLNVYPNAEIEMMTKKYRRLGLGAMGISDLMIKNDISYGSDAGNKLIEDVMFAITTIARRHSDSMGYNNQSVTCVAPTGSISLIAGCSSGVEPNFAYVYDRSIWKDGVQVKHRVLHPLFEKHLMENYDAASQSVLIDDMYRCGSIQNSNVAKIATKKLFLTTIDLTWQQHVESLISAQKYTEMSISKTINMPNDATVKDVSDAYKMCWEGGVKGITVYRQGSRDIEVLSLKRDATPLPKTESGFTPITPRKNKLPAFHYMKDTGCGTLEVQVTYDDNRPTDVFIHNSGGGCAANIEWGARNVSALLRSGVDPMHIVRQAQKVLCPIATKMYREGKSDGRSCAWIVGDCIKDAMITLGGVPMTEIPQVLSEIPQVLYRPKCPECGSYVQAVEGCVTCSSCGYSRCG